MIITIGSKVKDGEGNTYTLTEELGHGSYGSVYKLVKDKGTENEEVLDAYIKLNVKRINQCMQ